MPIVSNSSSKARTKKKVTLSIDSSIYDNFQKYCEENAIMLSKKIELYMKKEMEENE